MDTLRREKNTKSDATALLKEKDEIITQLMAKGRDTNFLEFECFDFLNMLLGNYKLSYHFQNFIFPLFACCLELVVIHFSFKIPNAFIL